MLFTLWTIWIVTSDAINDFRIGIQLCDGNAGQQTGSAQYTPWFRDSDGWAEFSWAGDSNYYDPDGIKVGLEGRYNTAVESTEFKIENSDIRFCIQLTDQASNSHGNSQYNGDVQCTAWASAGGGWSDWARDSNCYDFDAVRVKMETKDSQGLLITDVTVGVQLTDGCTSASKEGTKQYSGWLIGAEIQTSTWSAWAGDSNFYDPDAVKIYAGFKKSNSNTARQQGKNMDTNEYHNESPERQWEVWKEVMVIAVGCIVVVIVSILIGCRCHRKRSRSHVIISSSDNDETVENEGGYCGTVTGADSEVEMMITD